MQEGVFVFSVLHLFGFLQVGDGSSNAVRNMPVAVVGLSSGVAMVALGGVSLIETAAVLLHE